jgi:AAA15 family ATPase/GTPase
MQRVLSIVLAIANAPGGVVLIDEIENGLHYSVLKEVWQAIAQTARQSDVQVFATTHSWECLRWAHEAFSESKEYDLRVFRLDRADGSVSVASYDRERIESALFNAVEMR